MPAPCSMWIGDEATRGTRELFLKRGLDLSEYPVLRAGWGIQLFIYPFVHVDHGLTMAYIVVVAFHIGPQLGCPLRVADADEHIGLPAGI